MAAKKTPRKAKTTQIQRGERPDQIVLTMPSELKNQIMAKCKDEGIPMTQVGRILLESWVGAAAVKRVLAKEASRRAPVMRRSPTPTQEKAHA